MSPEAARQLLRDELADRREEHGTIYSFAFTEDQTIDLASGYVPNAVKAMARASLEWAEEDRRRAERPMRKRKK